MQYFFKLPLLCNFFIHATCNIISSFFINTCKYIIYLSMQYFFLPLCIFPLLYYSANMHYETDSSTQPICNFIYSCNIQYSLFIHYQHILFHAIILICCRQVEDAKRFDSLSLNLFEMKKRVVVFSRPFTFLFHGR